MKNHYFRTKDLGEASLLYASRKKLLSVQNEGGRCWFAFDDKTSCQELIDSYWRKEAVVDAKELLDAQRNLKDIIFAR